MELSYTLNILQDAGIEVDLKTLQNPSEEFLIDLVMEYLKRFYIDSAKIAQPMPEQLARVSYNELAAADIIKAINLYSSLSTICEGIFLKDLTLADFISPSGCKKTSKRINVLFNFLIYVRNKRIEQVEPLMKELEYRSEQIQEYINCTEEMIHKTGSVIHERERKLRKKEQLKQEIAELKLLMEKDEKASIKMQKGVDQVTADHQAALTEHKTLKMKTQELFRSTKELEGKIVSSPEKHLSRLEKLKKVLEEKQQDRQTVCDSINCKKKQIIIHEMADAKLKESEINKLEDIIKKLKETTAEIDSTKTQMELLSKEIFLLDNRESRKSKDDSDISTTLSEREIDWKILSELNYASVQSERELDSLKAKLEKLQSNKQQLKLDLKNVNKEITVAKFEYAEQLRGFKKLYDSEIEKEKNLREDISTKVS